MNNPNFNFFANSDLIPNVNPKDKPKPIPQDQDDGLDDYDDYGYVIVKNLNNINSYLQNREEQFSDKEVSRLIGRIKGDITK